MSHIPTNVALVRVDVQFDEWCSQSYNAFYDVVTVIVSEKEFKMLKDIEHTRGGDITNDPEISKERKIFVKIPSSGDIMCVFKDGLTMTRHVVHLHDVKSAVLQLLARPSNVWSYADREGHMCSEMFWEIDRLYMDTDPRDAGKSGDVLCAPSMNNNIAYIVSAEWVGPENVECCMLGVFFALAPAVENAHCWSKQIDGESWMLSIKDVEITPDEPKSIPWLNSNKNSMKNPCFVKQCISSPP